MEEQVEVSRLDAIESLPLSERVKALNDFLVELEDELEQAGSAADSQPREAR